MHRALIVDDRAAGREIVGRELVNAGFSVLFASDEREALTLLSAEKLDLIVTDHREFGVDGIELVDHVRAVSAVPVVILTAFGSISECERAMRAGADRFLQLRNDLGRVGELAHQIVSASVRQRAIADVLTTEEARALGQRELQSVLQRLVVECRGNIAEIARRMNRDRSTIRYHLRRMGMLERRSEGSESQVSNRNRQSATSSSDLTRTQCL